MRCAWQVEIDEFCQKVLAKHWPDVKRYGDVRDVGKHNLEPVDLICGGFPCQPFSEAGEQRGKQDDRNLWPEMRRVIAELQPRWVIAENVPGIRKLYLDTVLSDLESLDYTTGTLDLPAIAFGAYHIRHRIFIVAYTKSNRVEIPKGKDGKSNRSSEEACRMDVSGKSEIMAYSQCNRLERLERARATTPTIAECGWWNTEPDVGRVAYGISDGVDRISALGNAVVPQVAEWIGRQIAEIES